MGLYEAIQSEALFQSYEAREQGQSSAATQRALLPSAQKAGRWARAAARLVGSRNLGEQETTHD